MSISMDHDCAPHTPVWISAKDLLKGCTPDTDVRISVEDLLKGTPDTDVRISAEDLLKLLPTRKIAPKPTSYKSFCKTAIGAVGLVSLGFVMAALVFYCFLPNAQVHESQEATGIPIELQTSLSLTEMLEVIEKASKDISQSPTSTLVERLQVLEAFSKHVRSSLLTESAHIMTEKRSGTSSPNHGPSLSRHNHDSSPQETQKKPDDAPKAHPTGRGFPPLNKLYIDILSTGLALLLSMTVLQLALIPLLQNQTPVTTGSSTDHQFSSGSAERLEIPDSRRTRTDELPSEGLEAAEALLMLSTGPVTSGSSTDSEFSSGSAERPEFSESRRTDEPPSEMIERQKL